MRIRYQCCTLFLLLVVSFASAFSQIPNAGFEDWGAVDPTGWGTSNAPPVYVNVTKSTTAHSGSFAVKGEVITYSIGGFSANASPAIQSGDMAHGFTVNQHYGSVTGYYQFVSISGDRMGLNFAMYKGTNPIASGATFVQPAASYTQFSVPFNYLTSDMPDTCFLQFLIIGANGSIDYHPGSYFLVDDLAFGPVTDVKENPARPLSFRLEQNYPNPFNPTTTITYEVASAGPVSIRVYDVLGREVEALVDGHREAGRYTVQFNASVLASGFYLYKMQAGGFVSVRRMMVVK